MNDTRKPGKKRIMVQIWGTLAEAIERNFKSIHIKRDSYLNDLLRLEIENLASEVTFRNSDEVRERIQNRKLPDRKKLTLELDETVVDRMDEVLKERNIYRDSFVNRVLFFLVANESHLNYLDIDYERQSQVTAKPLADASYCLSDPFFHIRSCNENKFYTLSHFPDGPFGKNGSNLFALNIVISDEDWKFMKSFEDFGVDMFD